MELKNYKKDVIRDLSRFLTLMTETGSAARAYKSLWEEKNVIVGANGLPPYHYNLAGFVPDVCFKVPTGGGKTFLAANAIKTIFDAMPVLTVRAVVWLVPSDAILRQTFAALSNPDHPYRRKIDVEIYNYDGPGFCFDIKKTENYSTISDKIHSYIPAVFYRKRGIRQ